jgi:hypothetical protein
VGSEKSALMLPKPSADTHTSICEPSVSQKIVSETTQRDPGNRSARLVQQRAAPTLR